MNPNAISQMSNRDVLAMYSVAQSILQTDGKVDSKQIQHSAEQAAAGLDMRREQVLPLMRKLDAWTANPAQSARSFMGELETQLAFEKHGIKAEDVGLFRLSALLNQIDGFQAGLAEDVKLHPAQKGEFLGDIAVRLSSHFPKIVDGKAKPGEVSAQGLADAVPFFELTADDLAEIQQGISTRSYLQPGGYIATRIVGELAGVGEGKNILDAGSGEGGAAVLYAKAGARVTQREVNGQFMAVAMNKAQEAGVANQMEFAQGSVAQMSPKPNSLDAVTMNNADIYWDPGMQKFFERTHDDLKPGEKLVMNSYNLGARPEGISDERWAELSARWDEAMVWGDVAPKDINADAFKARLVEAGFDPAKIQVIDMSGLYSQVHEAVAHNQKQDGHKDAFMDAWRDMQNNTEANLGFIIVAEK